MKRLFSLMQSRWTALFIAVQFCQSEICKLLIKGKAKVDNQENEVQFKQ